MALSQSGWDGTTGFSEGQECGCVGRPFGQDVGTQGETGEVQVMRGMQARCRRCEGCRKDAGMQGEMQVDADVAGMHVQGMGHVFKGWDMCTRAGMHVQWLGCRYKGGNMYMRAGTHV